MSGKTLLHTAHGPGNTTLAFSRDGKFIYTGGSDSIVRIFRTDVGTEQEPDAALEAMEGITSLSAGTNCWLSGSEDAEVRQYPKGKPDFEALVTSAIGVPIRSIAVDPKGKRVAVASDETSIKLIELEDTTKMMVLSGHTKAVRRITWHPSGALLTSCGADGKIIVWDVSDDEAKQVKVIEGILPTVSDTASPEWQHDCSAVWHSSGQHFFVATRTHEIITVQRSDWAKTATFTDDACSGAITALGVSANGVYLASASKAGLFVWSTQNRRLMYRFQEALSAPVTQLAWSPSQNLLAWVDNEGTLSRWHDCIPRDAIDPVKMSAAAASKPLPAPVKRKGTPNLFELGAEEAAEMNDDPDAAEDDPLVGIDLDNDDWILDDLGGGMDDDDEKEKEHKFGGGGIREMVSVTKAQPPFQSGSTPLENKKRYLAYNMIGVIEVTDQDTHHVVNVEFHDRSKRKGYHFTDHYKYDMAALGERGVVYACQPESEHPAHVIYKPYGSWTSQSEWTYELPPKTTVLGVAAGGAPPLKLLKMPTDDDMQGQGTVVIATSDGELVFLTGSGIERQVLSLQGDFVSMVAGSEWVFVVHREGSTTMDGSQNLTGRLIRFDDFCLLQKDSLPLPKGHTLKWIGITEEGAPATYDSAGTLNIMPRFRIPFQATWSRLLDTNRLERREGKSESYWPVGVTGDTFMCLILKGRQEHPGFPRPLIQELPCKLPFKRTDPKEGPLEEHFARESMLLDILRDGLEEDELTTDDIARRELALDKELIQLIQNACKNDRLARALDLTKLLHHTASFDMALKVAGFYHLIGLQEKMEALKEDREDNDRLVSARDKRRERAMNFTAVPAPRMPAPEPSRPKPFQDFRPPPTIHRPGLERATPASDSSRTAGPSRLRANNAARSEINDFQSTAADFGDDYSYEPSPDGKRKRSEEPISSLDIGSKKRALESATTTQPRSNPFAKKTAQDNNRNPFGRSAEMNKSLHKSESFFNKVDAAEKEKTKRAGPGKGKTKDKKDVGKQATLESFKMPASEKKNSSSKKAISEDSQATLPEISDESQERTQETDVTMIETEVDEDVSQVPTELDGGDADEEPIDWPASPTADKISVS